MDLSDVVTLVNRTLERVEWMYDGRCYEIGPLESKSFLKPCAAHGRAKSRYGFDPQRGDFHYRLGIKEFGHSCDPIEETDPNHPSQYASLMHRRDQLKQEQLEEIRFSNPDLAMSRPVDGF